VAELAAQIVQQAPRQSPSQSLLE